MSIILSNYEHQIRLSKIDTTAQIDHIPGRIYTLGIDINGVFLIKGEEKFKLPAKIYGEPQEYADMLFADFDGSGRSMGVILEGLKGSGKTLTAEILANKMLAKGYPVLDIDNDWSADMIRGWINIVGPCLVRFDEFGKVYDEEKRKSLLTLFSDSNITNALFVITCNSTIELNEFILNRPGRFKYLINFENITPATREEFFDDLKLDDDRREIFRAYSEHQAVSFDILNFAVTTSLKFTNPVDMYKRMGLLNIPYTPKRQTVLTNILVDGEPLEGQFKHSISIEGSEVTFTLQRGENTPPVHEVFDWNSKNRIDNIEWADGDKSSYGSNTSKVQITADITLVFDSGFKHMKHGVPHHIATAVKPQKRVAVTEAAMAGDDDGDE